MAVVSPSLVMAIQVVRDKAGLGGHARQGQLEVKVSDALFRCTNCGGLDLRYRWEHQLWDEKACMPSTCSNWRVIGKSKNGGPLLSIVQEDES